METCVVELGTNNLLKDDKKEIIEKFKRMIMELKQRRKHLAILGILPRRDVSRSVEDKRLEINAALMRLCRGEGVDFIDVDFDAQRSGYLARDGLHLNWLGADMVARRIFNAVKSACLRKHLN